MRRASSGVAWWANPVTRMATTSGWNSTRSSSSRRPSVPEPRFQSRTARSIGVLVGDAQGGLGVGGGEHADAEAAPREPLLERPADGLLVVHDEDGVGHVLGMICEGTTNEMCAGTGGPRLAKVLDCQAAAIVGVVKVDSIAEPLTQTRHR